MRTNGTLQQVFDQAREYQNGIDTDSKPMQPVVRFFDSQWHIESGINGEPNATCECDLDTFQTYFYECPDDYEMTENDEDEFKKFAAITVETDEYDF